MAPMYTSDRYSSVSADYCRQDLALQESRDHPIYLEG